MAYIADRDGNCLYCRNTGKFGDNLPLNYGEGEHGIRSFIGDSQPLTYEEESHYIRLVVGDEPTENYIDLPNSSGMSQRIYVYYCPMCGRHFNKIKKETH